MNRIIVSMTSYPKRIMYVYEIILNLLNQTLVPDEIHLWLSEEEFVNKENDLPIKLKDFIDNNIIFVHWLKDNFYIHKRHEIFKYTSDDDLIFFFDDDILYPKNIIEDIVNKSNELNNEKVINYNMFHKHKYVGKHIKYTLLFSNKEKYIMYCGHSMFPSKLYPKFLLEDSYIQKRTLLSPISEECWINPWLIWLDIPVICMDFHWGKEIARNVKKTGLCSWYYKRDEDGLSYKDKCLYAVLKEYPFIYEKYQRLFSYDFS